MQQFRKKPVVVEAMQFTLENKDEVYFWVILEHKTAGYASFDPAGQPVLRIDTLEGTMTAQIGDWVVRGTQGEFYPVRDSIFREVYEGVEGGLVILEDATGDYTLSVPGSFVDALERVTRERDQLRADLEDYKKVYLARGEKIKRLENRQVKLSDFTVKVLLDEVLARQDKLAHELALVLQHLAEYREREVGT